MSREDLYYDEYFDEWELSSKEMDEFEKTIYNQALEDFETYAQEWANRQECIGRSVVKLIVKELIDSAKELRR